MKGNENIWEILKNPIEYCHNRSEYQLNDSTKHMGTEELTFVEWLLGTRAII